MRAKFKVLADALLVLDTWEMRELCIAVAINIGMSEATLAVGLHDALLDFAHENSVPFTAPAHAPVLEEYNQPPVRSYPRRKLSSYLTPGPL